ncbi:hypothetical protein RT99_11980 [Flavobacterium sp. MEB061]|nr:hypothetical protein RT99_11980 [Flavobacterium sp. MEB061]
MVTEGLKNSDLVFFGEVIKFNSTKGTYTFKIIELFKGKINSKIINGKAYTSCSISPNTKGLWIVFTNFKENNTIDISDCSPSIGLDSNQGLLLPRIPEKYFSIKDQEMRSLKINIFALEYEKQNLIYWIRQLEQLRAYKTSQIIALKKEETELKIKTYRSYIVISLIANIILFLILIFVLLKRKKQ